MRNKFLQAVLLIFISAVLYAFVIMPMYTSATKKDEHVVYLEGLLQEGEKLQQRRDALLEMKNRVSPEKRELLEQAITKYNSEEVVKFVIALNDLLANSALGRGTPFDIGTASELGNQIVAVPFVFNFGDIEYNLLLSFIETLRQWERGLRVTSIRITASTGSSSSNVQATIETEGLFTTATDVL